MRLDRTQRSRHFGAVAAKQLAETQFEGRFLAKLAIVVMVNPYSEVTMKKIDSATIDATPDGELLEVDPRWREVIEPITLFKDAIDRVAEARTGQPEKTPIRAEDRRTLVEHGIDDADQLRALSEEGVAGAIRGPKSFIKLLLGDFKGEFSPSTKQVRIPPWTALGQNYKYFGIADYAPDGKCEFEERQKIEQDLDEPACATCYGGIPLFAAGEGKNRGSFHRKYNLDQLIFIRTAKYPDGRYLELQSVAFQKNLVLLRIYAVDPNGTEFEDSVLLPFAQLSIPLLKAHGARELKRPWFGLFWLWKPVQTYEQFPWRVNTFRRIAFAMGWRLGVLDRLFIQH
jgi:hypothetical protein